MKLKKLLKYIDDFSTVTIWDQVSLKSIEWEIAYEGDVLNVPWYLADREIDDEEDDALAPYYEDGVCGLRIRLKNEVDTNEL